jgi:hypothetical protein
MIKNPALEYNRLNVSCFEVSIDELWKQLELVFAEYEMKMASERRPLVYEDFGPDQTTTAQAPRRAGLLSRSVKDKPATIMLTNLSDGWQTLAHAASERCACRCWHFTVCQNVQYHRNAMTVIDNGDDRRVIYAQHDPKWVFFERGEPLPIEDVARYRKRKVSERVTREYVLSLAEKAGFPLADDAFWRTDDSDIFFSDPPHRLRT